MQIGVIGLGRMGGNIARRLMQHGHACVVFDARAEAVQEIAKDGAYAAASLAECVHALQPPRHVWVMLPAGPITENVVTELGTLLSAGDTIIDGGNTFYRDDIRRAQMLNAKRIHYVDAGTSGGIWGYDRGYCLMIGGEAEAVARLDPVFAALAPGSGEIKPTEGRKTHSTAERGYLHCGPVGSGHFVKMVHNGIEYGLMEAYAEGFDVLSAVAAPTRREGERFDLPLAEIAELWRRGSVIGSWLLDLAALALTEDEKLTQFSGVVGDSGEGRWTVAEAIEQGVPVDVLSAALFARFRSRGEGLFGDRLLSAMRNKFGGHVESNPKK